MPAAHMGWTMLSVKQWHSMAWPLSCSISLPASVSSHLYWCLKMSKLIPPVMQCNISLSAPHNHAPCFHALLRYCTSLFSKVGAMHKPCEEAEPHSQEEAAMAQPHTSVVCSCRSYTTCIPPFFLLLFHVCSCRAPERASAWCQQLLELLPAHPGLQQMSEAVALEKQGRRVFTHDSFLLHRNTHAGTSQARASLALAAYLSWAISVCLLDCSLGEKKRMGLEEGFTARE